MTLIIVNHPKLGDVTAYLSEVDQIETTFMDIVDAFLSLQSRPDRYEISKRLVEVKATMQ